MDVNDARTLALQLMDQHGLIANGWTFDYDGAQRRFGVCKYRSRRISLSASLVQLNDLVHVKDVILHEIAHALTPGAKHGPVWKRKCIEIGAKPERCYDSRVVTQPETRYFATCECCGHTWNKVKRPEMRPRWYWCNCQKRVPATDRKYLTFVDRKAL